MDILVAIDFSESQKKILEHARCYANAFSAKLWILHVAQQSGMDMLPYDPNTDYFVYDINSQEIRNDLAKHFHNEHQQLQTLAQEFRDDGFDATALLIQGDPIKIILSQAERLRVDLLIIGSHGHGKLYQLVMGSISEEVLHSAKCPMLIVPSRENAR